MSKRGFFSFSSFNKSVWGPVILQVTQVWQNMSVSKVIFIECFFLFLFILFFLGELSLKYRRKIRWSFFNTKCLTLFTLHNVNKSFE